MYEVGFNDGMFGGMPPLFIIFFVAIASIIIISILAGAFQNITEWNRNNASPQLTVSARVVTKRTHVSHHHNSSAQGTIHSSSSTNYYVTFEVESGDRMEFRVQGKEYGILVEGDQGKLTFQGTRYLQFERAK